MDVRYQLVGWGGFLGGPTLRWRLAWVHIHAEHAEVSVRRGAHLFLFPLARLAHELEHVLRRLFDEPNGNDAHAAWWKFAVFSGHAIRLNWRDARVPRCLVRAVRAGLRRNGGYTISLSAVTPSA